MGLGVGIFLLALGAILTFAVDASLAGLNLDVVGVILMLAGATGIALDLAIWGPRRREVSTTAYPADTVETREVRRTV